MLLLFIDFASTHKRAHRDSIVKICSTQILTKIERESFHIKFEMTTLTVTDESVMHKWEICSRISLQNKTEINGNFKLIYERKNHQSKLWEL